MADGRVEILVKLLEDDETRARVDKLKGTLAGIGGTMVKAGAAATAAMGAATAAMTKQALDLYARYEQLAGGVQTLYGDDVASKVKANAAAAFETAGMSANQYLDTVTSFSASLITSLGGDTEKAADYADLAIRDMADNANKMGTAIESVQNAYQGFAKQNFSMLDNLKLGFGGSKEEMQRLLDTASEISKVEYDITNYADIVDAIHVIQDEMGLAGATAEEAATTIEGSVNTMKAAWENWLTGLGDTEADMGALTVKLVNSVTTAAKNVGERLAVIVDEILAIAPEMMAAGGVLFKDMFDGMIAELPGFIDKINEDMPSIIDAITDMLISSGPKVFDAAFTLFLGILEGLWEAAPEIFNAITNVLGMVLGKMAELPHKMTELGMNIVVGLWEGISDMVSWVIDRLADFGDMIVGGLMDVFGIHSPSTVMRDQIGRYLAEGVGVGFEKYNPVKDIQDAMLSDVTSLGMSARLSVAGATTNYFTIDRIDAHDLAGVNNVNALIELFNANA